LCAHGFNSDMIAGLIRAGLATAELETMKANATPASRPGHGCRAEGNRRVTRNASRVAAAAAARERWPGGAR
jgi:hypothetical protein